MLNKIKLSRNSIRKAVLAFIIGVLLIGLSCGKRKPPLPPVEKIVQKVDIFGIQRGDTVTLSWEIPVGNASDNSLYFIKSADVYRLVEALNAPLTLSEEEFASRSTLISTVPIPAASVAGQQINFTDTLELAGQPVRLRYAVRFVNTSGQKAVFSNFLLIEPTVKISANPRSLKAKVSENAVSLQWTAPGKNIDGSVPANILGYNVYRTAGSEETAKLLNKSPLSDTEFSDVSFEFGKKYKYFVRAVSIGGSGEPIESLDSEIVQVSPVDTFPPSPPTAITIAAAPKNLAIFLCPQS